MDGMAQKGADEKFCSQCGATIKAKAEICPHCGVRQMAAPLSINFGATASNGKSRITAAILALEQGDEQHATSIPAEEISKQLMKTAYGDYDQKYSCWKAKDADGQDYCMRIARTDKIMTNEGERIYVLATGGTVNEEGEPDGAHVQPGLVGAFVIKDAGNAYEVIASDPNIPMGAFGSAPDEWEFVQFGPSDYWGWQSQTGDMHQGYAGGSYVFLAIYGKKVRDIGGITSYFSNEGAVGDDSDEATSLETKLKIDTTATGVKVYPLLITVSGKEGGKKFSEKTWKIPFDEKQWKYVAPPDWPLADADY
jgi:ribosomal protein L40E